MSGATAAHASYNGSGTQGIAVTNKLNDTGDIISTIWGKDDTTKQLLHGASLIEIPSSGGGTSPGSVYTFTLNSDRDAIGDMYGFATIAVFGNGTYVNKNIGFLSVINRIEFHCGTQIWQTLEQDDLVALNTTELSEAAYEKFMLSSLGYISDVSFNRRLEPILIDYSATRVFSFKIPLLTRKVCPIFNNFSNVTEAGFLTACAPNQTVKIRIFTNTFADMFADSAIGAVTAGSLDLRLFGNHLVMCNEEREKIRNIPGGIAKRVKITQNANLSSFPAPRNGVVTAIIDCDHFSLFASHLIIKIHDNASMPQKSVELANIADSSFCSLIDADLRLNNTSYCGRLTGAAMSGPLADSMGLYVNILSLRTITQPDTLVYVFPLSNYAFSGAGVPLNRFDNIRLTIRIALDGTTGRVLEEQLSRVSVTCVGESTALYKQGAASISMY